MKLLFLDIETSPHVAYVWRLYDENIGLNQVIKPTRVICAAFRFKDQPMQFAAEWNGGHRAMVRQIYKAVDEADAVVHFNGASFDEKHLNREFVQASLPPPNSYKTIDLFLTVKKKFKFAASKLQQVVTELEVRDGKIKTDFDLWRDTLAGIPAARTLMEKYNKEDVELLVDLYDLILPWIDGHPNAALYEERDPRGRPRCTRCGSVDLVKDGFAYTNAGRFQKYRCKECGAQSRDSSRDKSVALRTAL